MTIIEYTLTYQLWCTTIYICLYINNSSQLQNKIIKYPLATNKKVINQHAG